MDILTDNILTGLQFGATDYFTQSHFTNISNLITSNFDSHKRSHYFRHQEINRMDEEDVKMAFMLSNLFVLIMISLSIVLGFIAVTKICKDTTERGKNTRLGLYALLILTGGQIGWLYILLWLCKFDVCT